MARSAVRRLPRRPAAELSCRPLFVPVREGPAPVWFDRAVAGAFVLAAAVVVVLLARVDPDARGYGTHEQLGMAPCGWPIHYRVPCPTCGVTTAACYLVHLQPWPAVRTQPFGAWLALVGLWIAAIAAFDLLRGRAFLARVYELRLAPWLLGFTALFFASWAYRHLVGI
jgi:hypothetical protein